MEWATAESMRPAKSTFVTVVAWIFIALDGGAAFITLIQYVVFGMVFPLNAFREGMAKAQGKFPPAFAWVFEHFRPMLLVLFVYALLKLVAAIGLLNRRNWARLFFIGILALGIVWSFAGIALQQYFLSSMFTFPAPPNAPKDFDAAIEGVTIVMRVFSAIFAIAFAVLYAWMIKRLMSPEIVAEFRPRGTAILRP
ncbi:MAG TPA: DUF2127 domain-containing protein [Rhodanobacteraceae bacterium]|nr:DUF2127 domain-containing protein [Rhodanobacteraceae bacterium]